MEIPLAPGLIAADYDTGSPEARARSSNPGIIPYVNRFRGVSVPPWEGPGFSVVAPESAGTFSPPFLPDVEGFHYMYPTYDWYSGGADGDHFYERKGETADVAYPYYPSVPESLKEHKITVGWELIKDILEGDVPASETSELIDATIGHTVDVPGVDDGTPIEDLMFIDDVVGFPETTPASDSFTITSPPPTEDLMFIDDIVGVPESAPTPPPPPTSPDYAAYVDSYPDLKAATAGGYGSAGSKHAWGKWHYESYGRGEGRTVPEMLDLVSILG